MQKRHAKEPLLRALWRKLTHKDKARYGTLYDASPVMTPHPLWRLTRYDASCLSTTYRALLRKITRKDKVQLSFCKRATTFRTFLQICRLWRIVFCPRFLSLWKKEACMLCCCRVLQKGSGRAREAYIFSCLPFIICVRHDSNLYICVTWLIHMCDLTCSYEWRQACSLACGL